ncbi:helix-turn-helix domain-containing protein [Kitasatospora sp. NPDC101157]|uniref:helix-turn-helix domain-containing protein n=1 Tax=Kitasatospora sp. NPDC101157 TaxID=3364098 RepID=UPI0037F14A98
MSSFKLNVTELRRAAEARGDRRQSDISRRTGLHESVVSRLMNGRDLSLFALMRLSTTYGVNATLLAQENTDVCDEAAA